MDEELRKMLEQAKASGASDSDLGKLIDMYEADSLKKKEGSQPSTIPKPNLELNGLDTSSASAKPKVSASPVNQKTGFPEVKQLPGIVPDYQNMPVVQAKKPKKEKEYRGQLSKKLADFARGSAQLGADISAVPELVYDAFSAPQNAIGDLFDIPSLKTSSDKFGKTWNMKNHVKDFYQKEVEDSRELAQKVDKQYEGGIYDSFSNGDVAGGFDQLFSSLSESLPTTISMMMGGAYAKAPQLLAASTMVFGAGKNEQLKKENPGMNENARLANALGTGLAEGAFETLSSGSFGAAAKGLVAREGPKKAVTLLKDGLYNYVVNSTKKNPLLTEISTEGLSEWATTVSQNSVDKVTGVKPQDYNVFTGGADAFISGVAGGAAFGGILKGVSTYQDQSAVKQNTSQIFELQKELNNPNISPEVTKHINSKIDNLIKTNQTIILKDKKKIEDLHPTTRTKLLETVQNLETSKDKAKEIQSDPNLSKESKTILLGDLKAEYKKNLETKDNILKGNYTPIDALSLKERDKIKAEALKQLTAELNPDGKKDMKITNEMVVERANKLYDENIKKPEYKKTINDLPLSEYNDFVRQAHDQLAQENVPKDQITDKVVKQRANDLYNESLKKPTEETQVTPESAVNLPLDTPQAQETGTEPTVNLPQEENLTAPNFKKGTPNAGEEFYINDTPDAPLYRINEDTGKVQRYKNNEWENAEHADKTILNSANKFGYKVKPPVKKITIKEAISDPGKTYVYNGEVGKLSTEGQQVVFETPTTVHELGNVDEMSESTLDKFGIQPESININKDGSIEIEGEIFTNPEAENKGKSIKKDKKGNYMVTLINSDGEKVTFKGPQADEIVYKTKLQSNEQTATTTSPITETEPQAKVQKQAETPKIEPEPAVEEPKNEPQTENAPVTDGNVRPGTGTVGEGTVVQQKNTPKSDVQKTKERRESERTSTEKKVTKGKNTFLVYKQDGEYVVAKQKDGKTVNEATRKQILQQHHAENNIYAQGKTAMAKVTEETIFNTDKEADRFVSENSDNASEVAEAIDRNRNNKKSVEETKDYADQKIADALKRNKLDKSAYQFGDKNNFVPQKGFSYFAKENGRKVDDLADEINVTPEEILDFIKRHPRLSDFKQKPITDNLIHDLEQRFEKITGVKPTTTVIADAMEQGNRQDKTYTHLDLMTEAELSDLYDEIQQSENKQDEKPKSKPKPVSTTTPGQTAQDSGNNQGQSERSGTQEEDFETKPGVKSISKRLLEGGNSKAVTDAVASTNINYEKDNQTNTWNKVADMFKEFNSFEMYQAIKNRTLTNESAITAAYGQLVDKMPADIERELSKITNPEDKNTVSQILWEEYGRIVDEFASRATEFGQANAMFHKVMQMAENVRYSLKRQTDGYKASNNGTIEPEVLRKFEETDAKLKEVEKKMRELELEKANQEAYQALENMQAEVERENKQKSNPKQQAKTVANKIREFKIHKPNSFSSGTPGSLAWDLGVETIAKTVEAGGTITEAIQNGLEKIKNTDWYKNLSKSEQDSARQDFNDSFAQDKQGNVKASTKMTTTPNGVEFPTHLFRDYVKEGMNDIDEIAKRIKEDIADEYPDAEVRDIRDGLSDYGKTINPAKDDISKEISRLKALGKLFSAKEDVLEGEMPKKSGFLRKKPDVEMRTLRKEIQAIMKEKGLDSADLEKRWASALDRIKSSLNNQIEELDKQIENGERRKVERTPVELDTEAERLKSIRDHKRKLLDDIVGKPELSEEQKIKRAERALESSIKNLQTQIDNGEFDAKKNNTSLNSPRLEELRNQKAELLKTKKEIRTESGAVERARLESAKKRVKSQLAELAQRIKDKNYSKKEIKPIRADEELRQLKEEKIRLFEVYDAEKYKAELKNRSLGQKFLDGAIEIINVMRIASGLDLGLMFLQLGPLTVSRRVTNPVQFAKDMVTIIKAIGSEKFSKKMNAQLKARQYYPLAEECKLALTSVDYKLSINEDQFAGDITHLIWNSPLSLLDNNKTMSKILRKDRAVFGDWLMGKKNGDKLSIMQQWKNMNIYPAVERGLVTYANTIRMQEFEKGVEMLRIEGKNQEDNLGDYKKVASAVNTLSGRANLPKSAAGINQLLSTLFFSPRNAVAIINQVNPFWYGSLQHNSEAGFKTSGLTVANKLAVHNMARYVAITATFALLIKGAYGDDAEDLEWDPKSYNAGKIRIKGLNGAFITFDPWAGKYHQISMFVKFATEQTIDRHTGKLTSLQKAKRGSKSRGEMLGEYLGNKLSPGASFIWSYLTAKTEKIKGEEVKVNRYSGEPISGSFLPSLLPMYWAGLAELQEQDPSAFTELLGVGAIMGVNTDVVKKPKKKKKKSTSRD